MDQNETHNPLNFVYHQLESNETIIHIHILPLKESYMVWVNSNNISMNSLCVGMMTKFDRNPICNNMFGDRSDLSSQKLSERLCKVTGKQIFVSCNIGGSSNPDVTRSVERFLSAKLKE